MWPKSDGVIWNVPRRNSSDRNTFRMLISGDVAKTIRFTTFSNVFHLAGFRFGILILIPNIISENTIFPDDVKIMKMITFRKVRFSHVRNLEKSHFLESVLFHDFADSNIANPIPISVS